MDTVLLSKPSKMELGGYRESMTQACSSQDGIRPLDHLMSMQASNSVFQKVMILMGPLP